MSEERILLPILGYGERLVQPTKKSGGGDKPQFPRTYQEARTHVKSQVNALLDRIKVLPESMRMGEIVATVRLNSKFLAKSYTPNTFFRETKIKNVGSRRWTQKSHDSQTIYSKMHFVKFAVADLNYLMNILNQQESILPDSFKDDIRKIEEFSLLSPEEITQGFDEQWQFGKVEMVLHPFAEETENAINKFTGLLLSCGVNPSSIKIKSYPDGPTFISAVIDRQTINTIQEFNPLRTIHPIKVNFFPEMRALGASGTIPLPPSGNLVSMIKIGIFDGGVDASHPFLHKYVKENPVVKTSPIPDYVAHGSAVAGVILYGPLNSFAPGLHLPQPAVSVESFRVFPLNDPTDYDLYEAIDIIEDVVPTREDISVYYLAPK